MCGRGESLFVFTRGREKKGGRGGIRFLSAWQHDDRSIHLLPPLSRAICFWLSVKVVRPVAAGHD